MHERGFMIRVDGREAWIDQVSQQVTVMNEEGQAIFRDRIQVAAGSVQGLFTAALGISAEPASRA